MSWAWANPWDTTAPPNAVEVPVRDTPKREDVSLARASYESRVYEPGYLPAGLSLGRVDLNLPGVQVDDSGATFDYGAVSMNYANDVGETVFVLSGSECRASPHVPGEASPIEVGSAQGSAHPSGPGLESLVWRAGERLFILTANLATGVSRDEVLLVARSVAVAPPCPVAPPTATPTLRT